MISAENRDAEAPAAAEPAASPTNNRKIMAQGFSSLMDVKKLLADVTVSNVNARFFFGKRLGGYRRHIYIVAKGEPEMEAAKEFLTQWYVANPPPRRPPKSGRGATTASNDSAESGSTVEGHSEAALAETVVEDPADAKSASAGHSFEPKITFTEVPLYSRSRHPKKSSPAPSSTAESSSETVAGAEGSEQPSGKRTQRRRKQKPQRQKNAPGDPSQEAAAANASGSKAAGPKPRRPRVPVKFVAQPGRVAVKLPNETTVEELRALLPEFPSTEIILKPQEARATFRNGRRIRLAGVTIGLIDVGEENQARAIEALQGKELRGSVLNPKPGRSRVRDESAIEKEESAVQLQPKVEHVESEA